MAIVRWMDPFRELSTIQERMNRMFEDFVGRTRGEREGELPAGLWAPTVDIYETDDDIVVTAELPGMEKEQVAVEYKDGILTLRGERKLEKEVKEESYHRMERSYGVFHRSFTLPGTVDEEKITARMKNGVLEVHLPKKEAAKPKQIKVAA
ncbi:MAG: Hsp20/alpha crystallin family protein [Deltaproteobacteria bacterium]